MDSGQQAQNVLVINCGSSSLKYQLLDMTDERLLAKGLVERIGLETASTPMPARRPPTWSTSCPFPITPPPSSWCWRP